jgi:hypothetical protein
MKDEFGNECPYDFKNMMFLRSEEWCIAHENYVRDEFQLNDYYDYFYTFSLLKDGYVYDATSVLSETLNS